MEAKPNDKDLDIQERIEGANKAFRKITTDFQVDFLAYPMYVPSDRGTFETLIKMQFVDTKYMAQPSPIQKEDIIKS